MIVLREIHGLTWWDHDGKRYQLHGRPLWIERHRKGWRMYREDVKRGRWFPSSDIAMAYVVEAFGRYGDPEALPFSNSAT